MSFPEVFSSLILDAFVFFVDLFSLFFLSSHPHFISSMHRVYVSCAGISCFSLRFFPLSLPFFLPHITRIICVCVCVWQLQKFAPLVVSFFALFFLLSE